MSDSAYTILQHDPTRFHERAMPFLLRAEAEYNLLIGIVDALRSSHAAYPELPYLATVERDGAVVGCAFRTPPYKLGLTVMPADGIPPLALDVYERFPSIPAVLARPEQGAAFAAAWRALTGASVSIGRPQRIYQLTQVTPPVGVAGELRQGGLADVPLISEWLDAFGSDAGHRPPDANAQALARVRNGDFYLWVDGEPVSMAARAGRTPQGERIGYVFTPRERRGHGYASALTAAVSRLVLDQGRRFCFLYTDLGNPTSNSIYQKIGYRPVCDVADFDFS